ncbi:MAG TPA: AprI/Inh family metalloprotease inhibitor [Xanthobacteraceae bacterium]|nr:AprI/Inh family metalloprotease inhibitor [Xanthobacteraceae bacterium]
MSGIWRFRTREGGKAKAVAALLALAVLSACSASNLFGGQPEPSPAAAPAASAPTPPPVDLSGRWQFSVASGGSCFMNFTEVARTPAQEEATPQGTIAPEGGCPGSFFTSRKWTFERGTLIMRDFKGKQLAQLSYVGAHFEGHDSSGSALTLSKQL